ncbi:hypothetical protein TNCV_4212001 [Trichonephila clavipes]|nr:hypothetical protein TNCV_4212001 [Trichonephila clavipes]
MDVKVSIGRCADFNFIWNDNLMAQKYTDEILGYHVVLYAATIGDWSLNAGCLSILSVYGDSDESHIVIFQRFRLYGYRSE